MQSYQIQLFETRISEEGTDVVGDDVALFDVIRDDGQTWSVATFLSPLFRVLHMDFRASQAEREQTIINLGARAIVERLQQGWKPEDDTFIIFGVDYPEYASETVPLSSDSVAVDVRGIQLGLEK